MSSSASSQSKRISSRKSRPKSRQTSKEVLSSHRGTKRKSQEVVTSRSDSTKFVITPTSKRGSRQKVSISNMNFALNWTTEFDYDDLVRIWHSVRKMPIFYRLINTFLLLIKYNDSIDKRYFALDVEEIMYEASRRKPIFEIDAHTIAQQLLQNIVELYSIVQLFPKASNFLDYDSAKFLYHGFKNADSIIIKKLTSLSRGDIFELPIFLSTSVVIDVACGFSGATQIILRIKVPPEKLRELPYAFFGNTIVVREKDRQKDSVFEHEILLNLFTKLKFIKISPGEEVEFHIPQRDKTLLAKCGNFKVIDMEFYSDPKMFQDTVEAELEKQITQFKQNRKENKKARPESKSHGGKKTRVKSGKLYSRKYIKQY